METIIRSIRSDLRLSMNGVTAASMREKGVHYRMNFGVDLMRIREIAARYTPDVELAEQLWKEDVRELKILAAMLFPLDRFTREIADRWVDAIDNQEIREQTCRNLFQQLPFAGELVNHWSKSEREQLRTTGYWLFARLCITRSTTLEMVESDQLLNRATGDLKNGSLLLRQAALNVLKYHGRRSDKNRDEVLRLVALFSDSADPYEREVLDQLHFEFGLTD
ncbi:MAG: DNA alkylation repair protein [Proteiniphilum sp.]|jgi:3-methyladenine DNA glycosylase AlkD